jgi:hypothetical protein
VESSESVSEWGERWLQEWVAEPGLSADDKHARLWLADEWRAWSLETWAFWAAHDLRTFGGTVEEWNARRRAWSHLSLFPRERNGLLVWRAFAEHRAAGLPVPEAILRKFDEYAARLEGASGAQQVARAIDMTGPGGGPQGAAHLAKIERARAIVSAVQALTARNVSPAAAHARVARERGMTVAAVRMACNRWARPEARARRKPGTGEEPAGAAVLRNLGR